MYAVIFHQKHNQTGFAVKFYNFNTFLECADCICEKIWGLYEYDTDIEDINRRAKIIKNLKDGKTVEVGEGYGMYHGSIYDGDLENCKIPLAPPFYDLVYISDE